MHDKEGHFLLKNDLIHAVSELSDKKAGLLFKNILNFVNDKELVLDDIIVNLVFKPIKQGLLEDIEKEKAFKEKCSQNGKKSAELRIKTKKFQGSSRNLKEPQGTLKYQEIVNKYNEICVELPKASLTPERIKLIDRVLKNYSLEQIEEVFQITKKSSYLNGKVKDWKANFGWLLNPNNFIKVLEGNYSTLLDTDPTTNFIHTND